MSHRPVGRVGHCVAAYNVARVKLDCFWSLSPAGHVCRPFPGQGDDSVSEADEVNRVV